MTSRPTIVFVRHGETDWNAELRLQGQRDIPMNARGRGQARRNGELLAKAMPEAAGFRFVSSPLGRARQTMELLRAGMGLDPATYELDPGLVEIGFGAWEGFTLEEMARTDPEAVAAREADKWNFVPPGGESYGMLAERIGRWLDAVAEDCVVVAHGAVGRVLRGHLFDLDRRQVPLLPAPQDEVLICRPDGGHWLRQPPAEEPVPAPAFRLVPHMTGG